MLKKIAVIAVIAIMGLALAGCHESNYRYSGTVGYTTGGYDDWGYGGLGWQSYPYYSPRYPRHYRHRHRHW